VTGELPTAEFPEVNHATKMQYAPLLLLPNFCEMGNEAAYPCLPRHKGVFTTQAAHCFRGKFEIHQRWLERENGRSHT
jgi:hypothetical protein